MINRILSLRVLRWPILLMGSIMCLIWGASVVIDSSVVRITALTPATLVAPPVVALALLSFSALGFWAITRPLPSWQTLLALLPQQSILIMAATASGYFSIVGRYGDGISRPNTFIFADQAMVQVLAALHLLVLILVHIVYIIPKRDEEEVPE